MKAISRKSLQILLGVFGLAILAFFALTRTQMGRDALANQLEAQFASSFEGALSIGRLSGTVVGSFTATDVVLTDRLGVRVLSVDSVIVDPSWSELLTRRLDVRRITLIRPTVRARFLADGSINLSEVLSRRERAERSLPWTIQSARIVVRNGSVQADRVGAVPVRVADGQVFDYTALDIASLDADLRVDRSGRQWLLNLVSASAEGIVPAVSLNRAVAQATVDSTGFAITQADLKTTGSRFEFDGSWGSGVVSLDVNSDVSFDEVRRVFPQLPVVGSGLVTVRAGGPIDALVINTMEIAAGRSRAELSGTVVGLPDSANVDLRLFLPTIRSVDLRNYIPDVRFVQSLVFDSLSANSYLAGTYERSAGFGGQLTTSVGGSAGQLESNSSVSWHRDTGASVVGSLSGDSVSPDLFSVNAADRMSMSGDAQFAVSGIGVRPIGQIAFQLPRANFGDRNLDGISAIVSLDGDSGTGTARLPGYDPAEGTAGGTVAGIMGDAPEHNPVSGEARFDLAWSNGRRIVGQLVATAFNAGAAMGRSDLTTGINGTIGFDLTRAEQWQGELNAEIDSSSVAGSSVLPFAVRATLSPEGSGSRVRIGSNLLDADIRSSISGQGLLSTGRFWSRVLADAAARELTKPASAGANVQLDDLAALFLRDDASQYLADGPADFSGDIEMKDLARLASLWPHVIDASGSARSQFRFIAGTTDYEAEISMTADSLVVGPFGAHGLDVSIRSSASHQRGITESLAIDVVASADSAGSPSFLVPTVASKLTFGNRSGTLTVAADSGRTIGPLQVEAEILLLTDRNRIRLNTLSLFARQYAWALEEVATIDLERDRVSVDELILAESGGDQRITVSGGVSIADTLLIEADAIRLEEITAFGRLRRSLGGLFNAELRLSGGTAAPAIFGKARADRFVLDGRLLGDVLATADRLPGGRDISIELDLLPADSLTAPADVDEIIHNNLSVLGSFRLPGTDDAGEWDANLVIRRADMFFLKYVFNQSMDRVAGYASGDAHIGGTFRRPVFDANIAVREGTFGIPRIGVQFTYEGDVVVDRDAIRILRGDITDPDGGTAQLRGAMLFNEYRFFSFDLTGDLNDLLVMNRESAEDLPFYGFIRGSGEATLTGPLENATLRIPAGRTRSDSELFVPIVESIEESDASFIIFADSTGQIPDLRRLVRRPFLLARRASAERQFLAGLDMDLNIEAARGSLIHLVIDPLLGDVINAESAGRVQLRRNQGEFQAFGQLQVLGGDYLFTAGEVFVREFDIQEGGTIAWEGDPVNAKLDIPAAYRTRASLAGLDEGATTASALIPLIVKLQISGEVLSPIVGLGLEIDRSNQNALGDYQALEARLNQPDRATEYATSVLLTNSFQLTTDNLSRGSGEQLAFNSVSQLVSSQLNRFLSAALPNVDFNLGVQGERAEDLDITYGVALRLLDERLIIRGEGLYQGSSTDNTRAATEGIQGEFVVEVRLSPTVSAQVFFRREGDIFQSADLTNTAGAGLSYQTEFPSWRRFWRRLWGLNSPEETESASPDATTSGSR